MVSQSQCGSMPDSVAMRLLEEAEKRNRDTPQDHQDESHEARASEHNIANESSPAQSIPRDTTEDNVRLPETVPESVDAHRRVPHSRSPLRATAGLSSQRSAPGEIEKMGEPRLTPVKNVARASSLSQIDTQTTEEFPSQMVRSWTGPRGSSAMQDIQQEMDDKDEDEDNEPRTAQTGDAGFVDLGGFEPSSPYAATQLAGETQDGYDDLLQSQALDDSPEDDRFAKPARPGMPQTPAPHGLNRGDSLPSESDTTTRTDKFAAFDWGRQAELKGQSQVFGMTQNPSSPMPDGPQSDPERTRPSPNFDRLTSPHHVFSSPIETRSVRPRSANNEPRDRYVSMDDSQKRHARAKELGKKLEQQGYLDQSEEDELSNTQDWLRDLRRTKREQISARLDKFGAPRPDSRPSSSRTENAPPIDLITPATAKHGTRENFDFDDDAETEDDGEVVAEGDELPEDAGTDGGVDDAFEDGDENDQYDEFSQAILRSQVNDEEEDVEQSVADSTGDVDVELEGTDHNNDQGLPDARVSASHALQVQGSTIANSQATATREDHEGVATVHIHQSSAISFVPGSQYRGKTSEDQAILASSQRRSQSRVVASQYEETVRSLGEEKMPSSPPLLPVEKTPLEDSAEASAARREFLGQFQGRVPLLQEESIETREIPESDLPEQERPRTARTRNDEETQDTNGAPYSTARTHVSASARSPAKSLLAPSPSKIFLSQQSRISDRSPRKTTGIMQFADMPSLTTHDSSFNQAMEDMADVTRNLFTTEDRQVFEMSSHPEAQPRAKRRKLNSNTSSNDNSSDLPAVTTPPTSHGRSEVDLQDAPLPSEAAGTIAESETGLLQPEQHPRALRDSPNKANEMPVAQSQDEAKLQESTTESQFVRERAGAHAVSQLVAGRAELRKSKGKAATYGMASRRTASNGEVATLKKKKSARGKKAEPVQVTEPAIAALDSGEAVGEVVTLAEVEDTMQVDAPLGVAAAPQTDDPIDADAGAHEAAVQIAPKRIFALFKGQYNQFYTATWLGSSADGTSCKVRFDDGTVTNVVSQHIRSLHLKVGDNVKVDDPSMRKKNWIIVGFGATASADQHPETDNRGHAHVKVQAKASRNSMLAAGTSQADDEVKEVPIYQIYLTHGMWVSFADRTFVAPSAGKSGRQGTPSTQSGTPNAETPGSRRRAVKPTAKAKLAGRVSHLRETSVTSSVSTSTSAIFSGMAFAISYGENEAEKAEVTRQIQRNGGLILPDGFEELFDLLGSGEAEETPCATKSTTDASIASSSGLQVKAQYQDLSFVALIADKHSRRAKYMQALALGLPTISGRWVSHSLNASKNPTIMNGEVAPLAWDKYLLPAGESSYLCGAIRSRTMTVYEAQSSTLTTTITHRPLLLEGEAVLLGPPKKGKAGMERRQTYAFLTRALGAGEVQRVEDLSEARSLFDDDQERAVVVYVDGDVEEAANVLFGKTGAGTCAGKRRKRASESGIAAGSASAEARMAISKGNIKIVNDEYVIQSLILGALVD